MIKWIKQHRVEALLLLGIIILAAFLRFYNLTGYMTFLGDEGRDALMIKRILISHDLPLIGPPSSVGNIYLGPLYYYMMAVPMTIFWLNPVAAAGMDAVIGVITVLLIYYLARKWFGVGSAVAAAALYAVSPVAIIYSHSSWNPNPLPMFALLAIAFLDKARSSSDFRWFILTGASLAAALQMHYLSLILLPVFGVLWFYELYRKNQGVRQRYFVLGTVGAVLAFLILMSPLAVFDVRHNFINYRAFTGIFSSSDSSVGFNLQSTISKAFPIYTNNMIGRMMTGGNQLVAVVVGMLLLVPLLLALKEFIAGGFKRVGTWPYLALGVWLSLSVIGLSFYKQEIYDHYVNFANPVPYLLLAGLLARFGTKLKWLMVIVAVVGLGYLNLIKSPLLSSPNNQLQRTQEIARFIVSQSGYKPFNFALIAANNYDAAYQFYLVQYGPTPKLVPLEITDQLFVVCEDKVCNPVGHPKYEIAGFGWAKIDWEKDFDGVKVFKLSHNLADPNYRKNQ